MPARPRVDFGHTADPYALYERSHAWGASGTPSSIDVVVRTEHLERGRVADPQGCPLALAIAAAKRAGASPDAAPILEQVHVSGGLVHARHRGKPLAMRLPPIAQDFLGRFDAGERQRPFSFSLTCYGLGVD